MTYAGVYNGMLIARLWHALWCRYDLIDMVIAGMHTAAPHLIVHHVVFLIVYISALVKDQVCTACRPTVTF